MINWLDEMQIQMNLFTILNFRKQRDTFIFNFTFTNIKNLINRDWLKYWSKIDVDLRYKIKWHKIQSTQCEYLANPSFYCCGIAHLLTWFWMQGMMYFQFSLRSILNPQHVMSVSRMTSQTFPIPFFIGIFCSVLL